MIVVVVVVVVVSGVAARPGHRLVPLGIGDFGKSAATLAESRSNYSPY